MTNYLKIDVKTMTLVYDRAFAKNCFIVGTAEYAQLQDAMKTFPNFKLVQRSIVNVNENLSQVLTNI